MTDNEDKAYTSIDYLMIDFHVEVRRPSPEGGDGQRALASVNNNIAILSAMDTQRHPRWTFIREEKLFPEIRPGKNGGGGGGDLAVD